jgi:hypothetical protein
LLPGRGGTGKQDPEKRRGRTTPLRASAGRRGGGGCAGVEAAGTLVFFLDGTLAVLCGQSDKKIETDGVFAWVGNERVLNRYNLYGDSG